VDRDTKAIELCKNTLQEKNGFVCPNIKRGNSLIDDASIDALA
jgi:hypothetical protein